MSEIRVVSKTQKIIVSARKGVRIVAAGPPGPRGPQGLPGPSGTAFVFAQPVASEVWEVEHGLGYHPNVTVVQTDGSVIMADVTYTSVNHLTITFSAPTSGSAYLS